MECMCYCRHSESCCKVDIFLIAEYGQYVAFMFVFAITIWLMLEAKSEKN